MPFLVCPNQVAFVPRRKIQDNIVITQEVFHKFRTMKGHRWYMTWKIDLAKAYNKLQWSFIKSVLVEIGIDKKLVELIMWCITSDQYQVILNDELKEPFRPIVALGKGTLSPLTSFVLCMEKLSHLISHNLLQGTWKSVRIFRDGPKVSHIFFADNLILFGQATTSQAEIMENYLDTFCKISGQQISFTKSRVLCSSNMKERDTIRIAQVCGSPLTDNLGKYLGVPLIHRRVSNQTYSDLVEKTQKRLAAWKSDTLSLAGRVTLIKL
ncbi:hypothetical protein Dsin_024246 [Dipteronia sinensis]|uniref:Reverse transcriptase domain-containing protein n=1 Tax=Dipteronia sinensis TaxID=43782 RepID=A0AAD9ZU40_9ROSI|nr:hypothetical protein Dsin_024246 [Dipteronia sinensis]